MFGKRIQVCKAKLGEASQCDVVVVFREKRFRRIIEEAESLPNGTGPILIVFEMRKPPFWTRRIKKAEENGRIVRIPAWVPFSSWFPFPWRIPRAAREAAGRAVGELLGVIDVECRWRAQDPGNASVRRLSAKCSEATLGPPSEACEPIVEGTLSHLAVLHGDAQRRGVPELEYEEALAAVRRNEEKRIPVRDKTNTEPQSPLDCGYSEEALFPGYEETETAASDCRKAAEQGHAGAQCHLGDMYKEGRGVEQNDKEAEKWYRKAAEQGNANAQFNLGLMCESGRGRGQSVSEAAKWYRAAAEQGHAGAQNSLGRLYKRGCGVDQSAEEAVKWYRKAAEQGDAGFPFNLGEWHRGSSGDKEVPASGAREESIGNARLEAVHLDRVDFSAIAPKSLTAAEYSVIQVAMYEKENRKIVEELMASAEEPVKEIRSGESEVVRGARIRVTLASPDIELEDSEEEGEWNGGYKIFSFMVRLPDGFSKPQVRFVATVYIQNVAATKLKFIISCRDSRNERTEVERADIHSAFVSYASEDRARVVRFVQGMQKVRPDLDVFLDVARLRSGEKWEERLYSEIGGRDVLYLCWSRYAKRSEWVEREWRYAFQTKGIAGIEPVPMEPPDACPPPEELSRLHFNDWLQYLAQEPNEAAGDGL